MWQDTFYLGFPVLLEKILRPVIVYGFLILALRPAGKRELAQLNPFDLVVLLTLSNTVQNAVIGPDNSVAGGLIGAATLLLISCLVIRCLFAHERAGRLVEDKPDVLIENGRIREDRLKKELLSGHELEIAAHLRVLDTSKKSIMSQLNPAAAYFSPGENLHPPGYCKAN